MIRRLLAEYGTVGVLLGFCVFFSLATITEQEPTGASAGAQLAARIEGQSQTGATVLIVCRNTAEDEAFASALAERARAYGRIVVGTVRGEPFDLRQKLEELNQGRTRVDFIAATGATASWPILDGVDERFANLGQPRILRPERYSWPNFLKATNLLNIVNQIAVIALMAIGMTMVIVAGGIDLSVGSLAALSAVSSTLLIRDYFGGPVATALGMTAACLAGIALCGVGGWANGTVIAYFNLPPFIVTLASMLVASGTAFKLAGNQSIYEVPESFIWLGRGAELGPIPNAVVLMVVLYGAAHVVMTRTTLGRYIYAVGGNRAACVYAGIAVRRVLIKVYVISALFAGLGGVVLASQLKSGSPTYGQMYELYVIAAVVVGGTSLSGGRGTVLGTLIGAFLIAVIQNGMNLTGVESNTQRILLGVLILVAVGLDMTKRRAGA
jgi:ribose transport system permease protein